MLIGYWILAGALALSNLFAAGLKFARTKEQLHSAGQAWVEDFSPGAIKAIGWALRQYGRTDPEWVRSEVELLGPRLSGLSRREALKHLR